MVAKVNAEHILVKTETEALACLTYMKQKNFASQNNVQNNNKNSGEAKFFGKSFEELAKEKSMCPSGKKGGSLGWFTRGMMVPEFEKAAFSGKKGDVVGPVKTEFGYHLIKIIDTQ